MISVGKYHSVLTAAVVVLLHLSGEYSVKISPIFDGNFTSYELFSVNDHQRTRCLSRALISGTFKPAVTKRARGRLLSKQMISGRISPTSSQLLDARGEG